MEKPPLLIYLSQLGIVNDALAPNGLLSHAPPNRGISERFPYLLPLSFLHPTVARLTW